MPSKKEPIYTDKANYAKTGVNCTLTKKVKKDRNTKKKNLIYTIHDSHKEYVDFAKRLNDPPITISQYKTFLNTYFELVLHRIVYLGFIFILPLSLGRFYFQKSKKRQHMKPYRQTFRKYYNLKWDKDMGQFKNRDVWKLISSIEARKKTKHCCKGGESELVGRVQKDVPIGYGYRRPESRYKD